MRPHLTGVQGIYIRKMLFLVALLSEVSWPADAPHIMSGVFLAGGTGTPATCQQVPVACLVSGLIRRDSCPTHLQFPISSLLEKVQQSCGENPKLERVKISFVPAFLNLQLNF